jgi:nitroreductase
MPFTNPVTELIQRRYSCRTYADRPIKASLHQRLEDFLARLEPGPFGTNARFALIASTPEDSESLQGLGTYGMIKNPAGYIAAAIESGPHDVEDLGYLMEHVILFATDLGLGTCWLGGTFTKSRFAERIALRPSESLPAVTAVGHSADDPRWVDRLIRLGAGSDKRKSWEALFYEQTFGAPLSRERAGPYAVPLDMVRAAPSASNKQPWRIVHHDSQWHFYLQRTRGYLNSDLQRVDMGIAMCHWALTLRERSMQGRWSVAPPSLEAPDTGISYIATWTAR